MTRKCERILDEMENTCDSQALAVADCLRTIAENGDEQAEDSYLVGCAEEIKGWAQEFIDRMTPKKRKEEL